LEINIQHKVLVPETLAKKRLDQALAILFPHYSRMRLKQWIEQGLITVNDATKRPKDKVYGGETIVINAHLEDETTHAAEAIALDILYEDDDVLVINKPAGLVVHPGAGNRHQTLMNALLYYDPALAHVPPRAGIIHRLDKETSGLLVVAKNIAAHTTLIKLMQERKITREYLAIVCGVLTGSGVINANIGRHPHHRTKMAVLEKSGRSAITHYRILESFPAHTLIQATLETGRTHQIRVHFAHKHHPLVGDPVYGTRTKSSPLLSADASAAISSFKRQALHAWRLSFPHPRTKKSLTFEAALPEDMQHLIQSLSPRSRRL
jgi:23S rRNA pseudouridine1911/1915/1917 synthase